MALIPLHLGVDEIIINVIDPLAAALNNVDNGKSPLLKDMVPDFIATDHTLFLQFLTAYYEWMETEGNPTYESLKMLERRDVDDTVDGFVKYFSKEFLKNFPETFASASTDKRKLVKNVKDFYRAKGTEESFELLFRLLFDETPEFNYPSQDILKLSSSIWKEPTVLKLTRINNTTDIFGMLGRKLEQKHAITGNTTAYGFVEGILTYEEDGYEILEVELSKLFGTFISERDVECELSSGTIIREYLYPTIKSIGVSSGASGTNYSVGDLVTVTGSSLGVGALGQVTSVDTLNGGGINTISMVNTGVNYRSEETLSAVVTSNGGTGSGVTLDVVGGGNVQKKSGYWSGNSGLLNSSSRMQDNDYYQAFSYVVESSKNIKDYADTIKRIIHPAGLKLFGHVLLKETLLSGGTLSSDIKKYEIPMSGHYTPYRFTTIRNLRANGTGGSGGVDLYPDGYGWSAGATGFVVGETGEVSHVVHSASGPMGGSVHIDESRGSGASHGTADSQGPGGTFNGPQGEQWNVVGGLSGWGDAISSGVTGGGHWAIYPHANSRGIASMPYSKGFTQDRLFITATAGVPPDHSDTVGDFNLNEYVVQENPFSQTAVGKIASINWYSGYYYLNINTISGMFLKYDQDMQGGSAGLLKGESGGSTAYINSVVYNNATADVDSEFNYITIKDFLFGIER